MYYSSSLIIAVFAAATLFPSQIHAQEKKKIAVVSFMTYKHLHMDPGSDQIGAQSLFKLTHGDDPRLNMGVPLAAFHDEFFNHFIKELDFEIIPEKTILSNKSFTEYVSPNHENAERQSKGVKFHYYQAFSGYPVMAPAPNIVDDMLKLFPEADAVLFVTTKFSFSESLKKKIEGSIQLVFYDRNKNRIMMPINVSANSDDDFGMLFDQKEESIDRVHEVALQTKDPVFEKLSKLAPAINKKVAKID